ncbi:MAG: hypothetical protein V7K67_25135 [Nostoc sp.]
MGSGDWGDGGDEGDWGDEGVRRINNQCPIPNAQKNAFNYRFRVNNRDI